MQEEVIAVITGSSKGIGKGIAKELGRQDAIVYVTGRDLETVEEVVSEIKRDGGKGIAAVCDMSDDLQIADLFHRVEQEHGHLNILVNNATTLNSQMGVKPFWEATSQLANILDVGLRSHHIATWHAARLLLTGERGLIVNVSFYADAKVHDPAYYASKAGLDKLAASYAEHFSPFDVSAVSLWPGFVATETMLELAESDPKTRNLRDTLGFESPEFCGRVIWALFSDPDLKTLSGSTLLTAELGERYNIIDKNGHRPKSLRHLYGSPPAEHDAMKKHR
ncbi:SDR family NAD(P)-dependent oxidoreductase [Serratia marcescens]|uniref:SDR family NAD(P)-dependent oxidoreductase n=1 Tax=Serratia marcescens TaxID=615 RepID=UPI00301B798B